MKIFPRRRFGQHWLKDETVLRAIVEAAELSTADHVLEIGPGTGILTKKMLPLVGKLTAVELDRDLCSFLRKDIHAHNFELVETDILRFVLPSHINKIVANIPYNITGEILKLGLGSMTQPVTQFRSIVLLVQKEIAQRLTAKPSSSHYGALSVRTQYLSDCEWIRDVPPRCFQPPPKVESAVIRLTPRPPLFSSEDLPFVETLIKVGFAQKRKMLKNNLQTIIDRDLIATAFEPIGIKPEARAEDLSVKQWIELGKILGTQ